MIADYLHIDQSLLSRIENGQSPVNVSIIEKLSALFGCSETELIEGNYAEECMIITFKNNNLSVEDLHAVAAINKIALNLRRMQQLLEEAAIRRRKMNMNEYIAGMDQYIEKWKTLKKNNPELAEKMAKQSLMETGVLDKNWN